MNKDNKSNHLLKNVGVLIISVVIGYLFYWNFSMEFINPIYNINTITKGLLLIFCHIEIFYLFIKILFKLKIHLFEKMLLISSYFLMMLVIFFDRIYLTERLLNFNIFEIINTMKESGLLITVLNILVFCPFYTAIKWIQKDLTFIKIFTIFMIFSISVEIIQYIMMWGIFDIIDIIFYTIGFFIGVKLYNFLFV